MSVPVHTIYKKELSDILTRCYDMITEIPKQDTVKTRMSRTAEVVGTEQNPGDSSQIVFSEDVLFLSKTPAFF